MIHKELSCSEDGNLIYKAQIQRSQGEQDSLSVLSSSDAGKTWSELPLKLEIRSWVRQLVASASWPPEKIDTFEFEDGTLQLEYRDRWIPHQASVLPFNLDQESLWRACYDSGKGKWKIEHLKYMDYDGDDCPPI